VHAEDTVLKLVEAANKTGSADLYDKLCERCNNEISKLFLGNTLTTEAPTRAHRHWEPYTRMWRRK
jgi:phage gp29-like protein